MPIWSIELIAALAASFAAVLIGSGGDILFLSSVLVVVPLVTRHAESTFALGSLVAAQGIVATLVGGVAYSRIVELRASRVIKAISAVVLGSLLSTVIAYLLPGTALRWILALAITGGAARMFLAPPRAADGSESGSAGFGNGVMLGLFLVAAVTGGLGVGGGFLFYIVLMKSRLSSPGTRGMALILTCANLATSILVHAIAISVDFKGLGAVVAGALAGSLLASTLIKRLDERVAVWGLRTLLVGSAIMSWFSATSFRGL